MAAPANIVDFLHFTRLMSLKTLADWPADKLAFQRTAEDNHPLWVMGHLAGTDAWIGGLLKIPGTEVPEAYQKFFGMGSKPAADLKGYPPADEVRGYFNGARSAMRHWLDNATAKDLAVSLKDQTGGFASDPLDAVMKLCWHEGWHMGQVATLRKHLGLPSAF